MRRIKQVEQNIDGLIECVEGLTNMYIKLQNENTEIYKRIRESNETLMREIRENNIEIKKLSDNLVATQVRMSRFENKPKFKEGDEVEEKQQSFDSWFGIRIHTPVGPCRRGTVTHGYYKNPEDVFVTYKILAEDKKDVFELPEHAIKLAEKKEEKKPKK